ncbi:chymotrypsin-2-like isoform X1 [Arctopsyche grandis]|uniref:chymotrypsin-2-like isoform X1 n=1 Tax=Arctopsyche grandis TaxID=121162 RepID=UPI00406D80F0
MKQKIVIICILLYFIQVNANQRIVGGSDAATNSAPYAVSFQGALLGNHVCGGAIISNRNIISAAHCFVDAKLQDIVAVVGTVDLTEGGDRYNVSKIIFHKDYNATSKEHDLAIIFTAKKIKFSNTINRVNFIQRYVKGGETLTFTGYGATTSEGDSVTKLQTINLTVLNITTCKFAYRNIRELFDSQICTFNAIGQGTCHGDSGGPLVVGSSLVGIASFGVPCAVGYPDVFTRTSSYIPWIAMHAPDI